MIISFDLGTTRLKVAAFDADGTLVAHHAERHDENPDHDKSGEADGWWQAAVRGTREVITRSGRTAEDISAFSLSGRAGACVVIDDEGHVIRQPWRDRRHQQQLDHLTNTGEHSLYGATLIAKYQWLVDNEPNIAARAAKLLYAKDTLCFRLTGRVVTDPSSGPDTSDWPEDVPIDRSLLPVVQLPWTKAGEVTPVAARQLGCAAGIPVAVGAHDGVSANIGAGVIGDDSAAITLGTHAVCRRITNGVFDGVTRFYGFPPDKHIYGANALAVGQTIDWWLATAGKDLGSANAILQRHRENGVIGSHGLRFLPYLAGQLHPEKQAPGNGAFTGLSLQHDLEDMSQALFEGCARDRGELCTSHRQDRQRRKTCLYRWRYRLHTMAADDRRYDRSACDSDRRLS